MILSTNRELFINKCNVLIKIILQKKMSLNYKKTGYMIINGKEDDIKCDLKSENGWISYKKLQIYLSVIFIDSGNRKEDITSFIQKKNKHVNVKLANFMNKNKFAPVMVKLKVVKACINSALTWLLNLGKLSAK